MDKIFTRRFAVARAIGVVFAAAMLAPPLAHAQAILIAGDAKVTVSNEFVGPAKPIDQFLEQEFAFNQPGAKIGVRTSLSPPVSGFQWLPFPPAEFPGGIVPPGYAWPEVFAGAELNAGGTGGVGVSGILQTLRRGDQGELGADAIFRSSVKNIGTKEDIISLRLKIPRIELAIVATDQGANESAFVRGAMDIKHYDASGALIVAFNLFEYQISFDPNGLLEISDGLLNDGGTVHEVGSLYCAGACLGFRFDPFEVTKDVGILEPGERFEYEYRMTAFISPFGHSILDGQDGGHAFYGDPLEINGQGSFVINGLTPPPVPEPSSALLLAGGGLALAIWRRRTCRVLQPHNQGTRELTT